MSPSLVGTSLLPCKYINGLIDFSTSPLPFIPHIQISIPKFVFEDRILLFSVCLGLNLIRIYDFRECSDGFFTSWVLIKLLVQKGFDLI